MRDGIRPLLGAEQALRYSLLDALRGRRSRRFGLGMELPAGPLTYLSQRGPIALTESEEALLAFAACGITGRALADLAYHPGHGGTILLGLGGRTVASGDAVHAVAVAVVNDHASYLLKRPQDYTAAEIDELARLAADGSFEALYRRNRVQIHAGRLAPPVMPPFNVNTNRWSLHASGSTYFLPINELTQLYINALLELFDEAAGAFILDERANYRPAGLGRFARSKGGHLTDDPRSGMISTIQRVEGCVTEVLAVEQGMMLQNLGLMTQALGLGGFPHFALHESAWFEALGFEMAEMAASRYLGLHPLLGKVLDWWGRHPWVRYPLGLQRDGIPLLTSYCPPYYPSMEAAVRAVVDLKMGPRGIFRGGASDGAWRDPAAVAAGVPALSEAAIAATVAYCTYVYERYGRFPAYLPPWRTVLGYQAMHADVDFYEHFYRPDALTETQREHFARWHQAGDVQGLRR